MEIKKEILNDSKLEKEEKERLISLIPYWADLNLEEIPFANADFTKLYDEEKNIFSIGFNIEENKLTNSYYHFRNLESIKHRSPQYTLRPLCFSPIKKHKQFNIFQIYNLKKQNQNIKDKIIRGISS